MYKRKTELRHLRPNDVYKLAVRLDENNWWKKLMEIIPKYLNSQENSVDGTLDWEQSIKLAGLKYNLDDVRLIESAIQRQGESRLIAQILLDEWSTSGRKDERPTVGVLLQLLIKAELFKVADYVAEELLKEPPPSRPSNGPAARIDISLSDEIFDDIQELVNDSANYPPTEALIENANNSISNNRDYFTKYKCVDKNLAIENCPPQPPPRMHRTSRQQLRLTQTAIEPSTAEAVRNHRTEEIHKPEILQNLTSHNIPNISELMTNTSEIITSSSKDSTNETNHLPYIPSNEEQSKINIPLLTNLLAAPTTSNSDNNFVTDNILILPNVSELNINGIRNNDSAVNGTHQSQNGKSYIASSQQQNNYEQSDLKHRLKTDSSSSSSLSNDSINDDIEHPQNVTNFYEDENCDDDNEDNIPNWNLLEQRSSNNDSSLTTVTGTSGENSFELNDCSLASNENIQS